jgi:hypothetical protein
MLTREQAQERLQRLTNRNYYDEMVSAARKLAGSLRETACTLLYRNTDGDAVNHWSAAGQQARMRAIAALEKASAKEREHLLRMLFGELASAVELAWSYLPGLTYQQAADRRPFRIKGRPELFRERRFDLVLTLAHTAGPYSHASEVTLTWLATWAPYLYGAENMLGILFAAVIDAGGKEADEIYDVLTASAKNELEIGAMGRHVTRALLTCARPEAWEFVEKLLLAAQRQEGLRQVVLETVDEAHPAAFRRMLRVIIDNNLVRFSAVARAINVWFGFQWDSISNGAFNKILSQIAGLLESETACDEALNGKDPEAVYHALWAIGYEDASAALKRAQDVLRDKKPEKRFAALTLVSQLQLPDARLVFLDMMADDDLRLAVAAHRAALSSSAEFDEDGAAHVRGDDHFERLEKLLVRVPERKSISMKPLLWPWNALSVDRAALLNDLVHLRGERPMGRVLAYLDEMDLRGRVAVALQLASLKQWDADSRGAALVLAGDASSQVRECVLRALEQTRIDSDEAAQLEGYLTRKAADLRRGVVRLLLSQNDDGALASAARLLDSAQANQRLAGLELLRQLVENDRDADVCRQRARGYQEKRQKLAREEQNQLDAILAEKQDTLTLDNALGLMNPAERTPVVPPKPRKVQFITSAASACLVALDAFVDEHKNDAVKVSSYQGEQEQLLGNVQWGLPWPDVSKPREEQLARFPLRAVIETWCENRPKNQRDPDGFELRRAEMWSDLSCEVYCHHQWQEWEKRSPQIKEALQTFSGGNRFAQLRYPYLVRSILRWLRYAHPDAGYQDYLLDATESLFAQFPPDGFLLTQDQVVALLDGGRESTDWRTCWLVGKWVNWLHTSLPHNELSPGQVERFWAMLHWFDEPVRGVTRGRPPWWVLLRAYEIGCAGEADVLEHALGPRGSGGRHYGWERFDFLNALTARKPDPQIASNPRLLVLADRCRQRLLEIELARGETATPASQPATQLGALFGIDTLVKLLHGLGKAGFQRSDFWRRNGYSKPAVLSALVRVTFPAEADTQEQFTWKMHDAINAGYFPEDRLIELAFQAPQWGQQVAQYYGWPGFQEGLWWFLAHMSAFVGDLGDVDVGEAPAADETALDGQKKEVSPWEKIIRQRTPLSEAERRMGAIDMAWFRRVYEELGDKRWRRMGDAARWASTSARARKALHLGDVILGKASLKELIAGIKQKHLKESVRLLGIYPLPDGPKHATALDERYRVMVDYRRYAKQLSAMSKPVAMQAAQIGMENLARTAGFADPIRLEWAQEARSLRDIAGGPVRVTHQGITASLFLDDERQPQLIYEKAGKPLKSLPAELKKHPKFAELIERRTELKRQGTRIKESLENAMCRGDAFTAAELRSLMEHPLLAPLLERLVLAGDGILGYPAKKGQALRNHAGKLEPVKKNETLRIAHPHDLLDSGDWHAWQRECFHAERVQPFKQVFRELYVVTKQEKKDGAMSLRYNGQQVNPQQASALFNTRNWNTTDGITKTFYDQRITTTVWFKFGWGTPLDVEGWTLEGVDFRLQDELKPMPLAKVPPRLFSEVMRDVDLVVSVAHRGGVDPEASASTVEMRANLLRETCDLLKIGNYKIKNGHVLVDGKLGDYSVHLGSAVVHRRPGGAVCILPVHAQHRGRLFLPFADDNPRTAEVISKVLLLARDSEIQDPTILEQLR